MLRLATQIDVRCTSLLSCTKASSFNSSLMGSATKKYSVLFYRSLTSQKRKFLHPINCLSNLVPPKNVTFIQTNQILSHRNNILSKSVMRSFKTKSRAYPQYTVFGETAVLSLKTVTPKFKEVGNDASGVALEKTGKISFNFSPRSSTRISWDICHRIDLSPDEIGLLLSQLPNYPVEILREGTYDSDSTASSLQSSTDQVTKVFTAAPMSGARVCFKYNLDNTLPDSILPLEVIVHAGEWEVMRSLMQESLPHLLGWHIMMDINLQNAVKNPDI